MRTVREALRLKKTAGDVGVEIEVEGWSLPRATPLWRREDDTSLRGESGEYVLDRPVPIGKLDEAFKELEDAFTKSHAEVVPTYRAGVHVHVNVQELTTTQLFNYIVLFLILEETLVEFCDNTRQGNHFCLRAKDAGYLTKTIWDACEKGDMQFLNTENIRYSAMNLSSLFKYGSIEFRSLESTRDFDKIKLWCNILYQLKEAAITYTDPISVITDISLNGNEAFVKHTLKQYSPHITSKSDWMKKLKEGVRNAQDIAFSRIWNKISLDIFAKDEGEF